MASEQHWRLFAVADSWTGDRVCHGPVSTTRRWCSMTTSIYQSGHVIWASMLLSMAVGCSSAMDSADPDLRTSTTIQASSERQDCLDTCERAYNEDYDVCMMTPGNWPCYMLA